MNIKKCAAALLVGSVLLTGCSSSSSKSKTKDGKDIVASLKDKDFSADDVYSEMVKTSNGKNIYFEAVLQKLIDKKCPVDDAMEKDADDLVTQIEAQYKANYGENGETQLETALASQGYANMNAYREKLISAIQYSKFLELYVNDHYDEVFEDYYKQANPRMISMVYVKMSDVANPTETETAKLAEVTKLVNSSKDFGEIATDYSDDETSKENKGKLGVIDTTSSMSNNYGSDVETKALALGEGEYTSSGIKGSDGYYFLKCTSVDKEAIKKAIKDTGIDSPLLAYDENMMYLAYKTYDITYKDDQAKEIITKIVDEKIAAREAERAGAE